VSAGKLLGVFLIIAGAAALVYHGFTYTRNTHATSIGPVELAVRNKETVEVPTWAGIVAVAGGAMLLLAGGRKG
jgi:hypothetical protein